MQDLPTVEFNMSQTQRRSLRSHRKLSTARFPLLRPRKCLQPEHAVKDQRWGGCRFGLASD